MIDNKFAIKGMTQWADGFRSNIFKESIKPFADKILESLKKEDHNEAVVNANKSIDKTISDLSDKQAEAIIFENIFIELIRDNIDEQRATEILENMGYTINPNPIAWLKQKISGLRDWIIDAIKWLRNIGQIIGLIVKEISVEIGISPRVSITFKPIEDKS